MHISVEDEAISGHTFWRLHAVQALLGRPTGAHIVQSYSFSPVILILRGLESADRERAS
jgi:hypothetical protein